MNVLSAIINMLNIDHNVYRFLSIVVSQIVIYSLSCFDHTVHFDLNKDVVANNQHLNYIGMLLTFYFVN